jgi:alpha-beta hydrolase superfamily lysophospholipase
VVSSFVVRRPGEPDLAASVSYPEGAAKAAVFIVHGHGEHIACYQHVIDDWRARGFAVACYDLRGHGNSGGPPSHITHFDDYLRDSHAVLDELARDPRWKATGRPIVFAHSLGALIAIQLVLSSQGSFRGLALSSPYLGLAAKVSRFVLWLGRALSRSWPTFTLSSPVRAGVLTHDPERIAFIESDRSRTPAVTSRFFSEVERVQALTLSSARDVRLPVYCLAAGNDRVVDVAVTQRWFSQVSSRDKQLVVIPGAFHELLNEIERAQYLEQYAACFARWADNP